MEERSLALDLTLLGFEPSLSTSEKSTAIDFFCGRPVLVDRPNARLLDEILYFLQHQTDASLVEQRLQPHWPPLNSLQSRRFRGEFLKCYEETRRAGLIDRQTGLLLRKSMLEEGKGGRLEEVLAGWAASLLEKSANSHKSDDNDGGDGDGTDNDDTPPEVMTGSAYACECLLSNSSYNFLREIDARLGCLLSDNNEKPKT